MNDNTDNQVIAKGLVERIGIPGSRLEYKTNHQVSYSKEREVPNHRIALEWIIEVMTDPEIGVIKDPSEIDAVGHRVVHGGEKFTASILIDNEVLKTIRACSELAPLHNPPNISGIEACQALMPKAPQIAVFDTAFHGTIPEFAYIYAIPYEYYEKYGIRRYGFHGTSHRYVAGRAAKMMGKDLSELRLITCHMGSGVSFTAIKNGKSIDTSMGLTPLEGLMMGTRCGDLDPAIPIYMQEQLGYSVAEVNSILNKKSGMLGLSHLSNDMRTIEEEILERQNPRAIQAHDVYCYRIKKYIGAYFAALNGLDILIFTGGVGERMPIMRAQVCENLEALGIKLNQEENSRFTDEIQVLSTKDSKVMVLKVPTNEELMIALETQRLLKKINHE